MQFNLNKDLAEFYGILLGDGCLSKYKNKNSISYAIRIDGNSLTDRNYYIHIQNLIFKIIKRKININYRRDCNGIYVSFLSKPFSEFLNKKLYFPYGKKGEIKISNQLIKNKTLLKQVLMGFFDTDGSLYFTKNNSKIRYYPIIELSTHSKALLYQLKELLDKMNFNAVFSYYKDSVKLHGKGNLERWMKLIGSNNNYKYNRYLKWKNGPNEI